MKIATVSEMRRLDKTASEQFGIKEELLMENAGESAYLSSLNISEYRGRDLSFFAEEATMEEMAL